MCWWDVKPYSINQSPRDGYDIFKFLGLKFKVADKISPKNALLQWGH